MALTPARNAQLARRLDALGSEARDKVREALPPTADDKFIDHLGEVSDPGDEASNRTTEQLDHAVLERYLGKLGAIQAARRRLADNEIDRCVQCGGEIAYERLKAYPLATRCIDCQARHEQLARTAPAP